MIDSILVEDMQGHWKHGQTFHPHSMCELYDSVKIGLFRPFNTQIVEFGWAGPYSTSVIKMQIQNAQLIQNLVLQEKLHSMNFGQFYGTFYVEVGNFSVPELEGKNSTAHIFIEEKKKIFCLENGHLLIPAFWLVNLHRNQSCWYDLFIFDALWFHSYERT